MRNSSWLDVAQFPRNQQAGKEPYGQADPRPQRPHHFSGAPGIATVAAQQVNEGNGQAGHNGEQRNEYKACHGQDYLVNARFTFVLITVAALISVAATASLGMWQLSRAAEKQSRQAAMDAQSAKEPLTAAAVGTAEDPMALLHQRARLRGTWATNSLLFLENRPMDGRVGFLVLMPLVLEGQGGAALVVQRGWVPRGFQERAVVPMIDTPPGVVELEGRVALPPSDLYALGAPAGGVIRQNLDLRQWRAETGLPLLPVTLQQTGANADGLLRHWPVVNLGVEKNIGYAVQWFGLAVLFMGLYFWFQVFRRFFNRPTNPRTDA